MAPQTTESSILESYLLPPASLPNILSFAQFQQQFPTAVRLHPQIKTLYRDLQFLRTVDVDFVRENIAAECKRADVMKREMLRTVRPDRKRKREGQGGDGGVEVALDNQFFGPTGMLPKHDHYHNVGTLLADMEAACQTLEEEAEAAEGEADAAMVTMKETVGGLSDLRYGKFAKVAGDGTGLENIVVDALQNLGQACERQ